MDERTTKNTPTRRAPARSRSNAAATGTVQLSLTAAEVELVRNALKFMEDTYGHEEADQLEQVQALLAKLGD